MILLKYLRSRLLDVKSWSDDIMSPRHSLTLTVMVLMGVDQGE